MNRVIIAISGGSVTVEEAPAGTVVVIRDYDCPDDFGTVITDEYGGRYQQMVFTFD